jgi:ankyrin repeat protein
MKDNKHIQSFNEHQENLNISDVISSINNYDTILLKKSISTKIVNKQIFKIFVDDKKPLWTPLIKISTLKKYREDDERYNGSKVDKDENDDCDLAKIIIDNGADLNTQDRNGNTALHYCVYYRNYKLMELLVKEGANINIQDNNGNTPLQLSVMRKYNNFSDFLIKNGADKTIKNFNGENLFNY